MAALPSLQHGPGRRYRCLFEVRMIHGSVVMARVRGPDYLPAAQNGVQVHPPMYRESQRGGDGSGKMNRAPQPSALFLQLAPPMSLVESPGTDARGAGRRSAEGTVPPFPLNPGSLAAYRAACSPKRQPADEQACRGNIQKERIRETSPRQ